MKNIERCGEARVSICKKGWGPGAAPEVRRYLGASPGAPRAAGHGGERHWRGPSPKPHSVGGAGINMVNRHMVKR